MNPLRTTLNWLATLGDRNVNRRELLRGGATGALFSLLAAGSALPAIPERTTETLKASRPLRRTKSHIEPDYVDWSQRNLPPGRPHHDYTPIHVPNGWTLPYELDGNTKVFHLVMEPIQAEPMKGLRINAWGFNGTTPGPLIEAVQGDRVRIYVTNKLPAKSSVHWHALIVPNGMDGVSGFTQWPIPPGRTGVYEFVLPHAGTFMYHPHFDDMTEIGMGMTGLIAVHPRNAPAERPGRDFAIMLHEMSVPGGTNRPNPLEMTDFNVLTMNGHCMPETEPLVAQLGDRVRIRFGNLGPMDHHPIHLHGYRFKITETDGGPIPASAQWPETTVLVAVGSTRTIEFIADNPGDWLMHCHMTHHAMNQMGHDFPNMLGVEPGDLEEKMNKLLPDYMLMGTGGMGDMADMKMAVPANSAPMRGYTGQFGNTVMGGMATLLKVREKAEGYGDPGPYDFTNQPNARLLKTTEQPPNITRGPA